MASRKVHLLLAVVAALALANVALGALVARATPTSPGGVAAAPPANARDSQIPTAVPLHVELPPVAPVPNQVVIRFEPSTTRAEREAYVRQIGGAVVEHLDALHSAVVRVPTGRSAAPLVASADVRGSEPDYYVVALDTPAPNDPLFPDQWALAAIGAPAAWSALPAMAESVAVAVIDSGVCADHPDLAGRVLPGYDFVEDDTTPQDPFGHGCSVAGIIAANSNDGIGMAGVAPNTRVMPLRVLNAQGLGSYSDVAAAILHAVDNGAMVLNLSLGGANASSLLEDAVRYAVSRGVVVVAAAGNSGQEGVLYPARYTDVIAVGSVDRDGQRSSFSTYGPELDLLAPGRDVLATTTNGGHATVSGTSFAAPHVAAAAALERARGRTLTLGGSLFIGGAGGGPVAPPTVPAPTAEPTAPPVDDESPYVAGELIVKFDAGVAVNAEANATGSGDLNALMASLGVTDIRPLIDWPNGEVPEDFPEIRTYYVIEFAQTQSVDGVAGALASRPDVEFILPNYIVVPEGAHAQEATPGALTDVPPVPVPVGAADKGEPGADVAASGLAADPNDTEYHNQWNLTRVNARAAWDITTGGPVVVAVLDTGLDTGHPDLGTKNTGRGYNFVSNNTNISDDGDHGTAVSGIIAAISNNNRGVAGISWNARILPVKVLGNTSTISQVVNGMLWAAVRDARVINMSLGFQPADTMAEYKNSRAHIQRFFDYLHEKNVVVVASAGNWNEELTTDSLYFPKSFDHVILVGAVGDNNVRCGAAGNTCDWGAGGGSGTGARLDVVAPGSGIWTTDRSGLFKGYEWFSDYTSTFNGTSSAAPHVAGIAALMLSVNPSLTPDQVEQILKDTAVDLGTQTNGRNDEYGFGLVNAAAAVRAATNDDFDRAIRITGVPYSNSQPVEGMTTSGDDPFINCPPWSVSQRYNTVWYRYTPAVSGTLTVNTLNSQYDTFLAVWTGTRGNLQQQACNDDYVGLTSQVSLFVNAGVTYQIEVASFGGTSSSRLNIALSQVNSATPAIVRTAPPLRWPTNASYINVEAPQLQWGAVTNAASYLVEVDDRSDFVSPIYKLQTTALSYTASLPNVNQGRVYYWRVRGYNVNNVAGPVSPVYRFTVDTVPPSAPSLLLPANGATTSNARPQFTWTAGSGATRYEIQIYTTTESAMTDAIQTGRAYTPPSALLNRTYSWRVRSLDAAGNMSDWAGPRTVTITSASSVYPIGYRFTTHWPTLTWTASAGAASYDIQVANRTDFAGATTYNVSTLHLSTNYLPNGLWYWRVRARRANNTTTGWSSAGTFLVDAPD